MQSFGALALGLALAVAGPTVQHPNSAAVSDAAEVYVAELDADWNVSREVRVPCDVDHGCAVDLMLSSAGAERLHVRFDAVHAGKVDVESAISDATGRQAARPPVSLALDRQGFAVTHVGADGGPVATDNHVIVLAVRVPGFLAPAAQGLSARGQAI